MASRSEGLESSNRPCLRAVTLVVLEELGFGETFLLSDFSLSSAALAIKACLRSSLAVLEGAEELGGLPPVLSSKRGQRVQLQCQRHAHSNRHWRVPFHCGDRCLLD